MARPLTILSRPLAFVRRGPTFMLGALLILAPVTGAAQSKSAAKSADQREMESYRLTKAKMDKWMAAQWGILKLAKEHPEFATETRSSDHDDDDASDDQTLDQMAARMEKLPEIRRTLQQAGMTAREYSLATLAVFQASFAYAMKKQGLIKEIPAEVPPAHVALVAQYEQEMIRLQAEMKKLQKPHVDDEADDEDEPAEGDTTRVRRR